MNEKMETLSITNFRKLFGSQFKGHAKCFRSDCSSDGNSILIGFIYAAIPDQMASPNIFEGQSSEYDSWIARFVYDEDQKQLVRTDDLSDSILIRCEDIRSFVEYEEGNILVSTDSNSIIQL